ncbi:uncharacterized protein LOC142175846 [Nicotiana tabacum]|uniref:Uncharacterized protein LOC142175846 n=1 Tax=Nicotiana tabacum TaxID=4097 RepID=A0AC58TNZ4_TOBAC
MAVDLDMEELLIMGDSDLVIWQTQGECETRDIKLIPYRQHVEDLSKRFKFIEFRHIPRFHNELASALTTLASMLPYPGNVHIDPLEIQIRERHVYCNTIEIEPDGHPCLPGAIVPTKNGPCLQQESVAQEIRSEATRFETYSPAS